MKSLIPGILVYTFNPRLYLNGKISNPKSVTMKKYTMKKIMFICLLTYWCISPVLSNPVIPQPAPVQSPVFQKAPIVSIHLVAHRMQNHAAMVWHVNASSEVAFFEIERSYDGEFFEVIGNKACNNSPMHKHVDSEVFPGYIHYRVKAYLHNGDEVYSDVSLVRIIKRG